MFEFNQPAIDMKTILLPTDFSSHSETALQFAIHIAKLSNAKLIVSHCFFVPNLDINTPTDILEDMYIAEREASEKSLMQYCQRISLHKNNKGESIPTEFLAEQNIPSSHILSVIQNKNIDLIVMGVANKNHLFDLLGSTALHVTHTASCPVLLVHEKSEYRYFNKVYFALENIQDDLLRIKRAIPLTRLYDSELSILHIEPLPKTSDALEAMLYQKSQYDLLLNKIIQKYKHYPNIHFRYNISDDTFNKMTQILKTEKPDLLILIHKDQPLLKSVFHKSTIKHILKNTNTPLLIIH